MKITFTLNGIPQAIEVEPFLPASHLLALQLGQQSVKTSCGIGRCGGCMVLLDGVLANGCLLPAAKLQGRDVVTAQGLGARADRVVAALERHGAVQCGYCAPGLLVSLVGALESGDSLSGPEVEEMLTGNLCRCTGYAGIRAAIRELVGG